MFNSTFKNAMTASLYSIFFQLDLEQTKLVKVIESDTAMATTNLDGNVNTKDGNYETAFYIVIGSYILIFVIVIILSLAIYYYSVKKTVNSGTKTNSIEDLKNEPEANENEVRNNVIKKNNNNFSFLIHENFEITP